MRPLPLVAFAITTVVAENADCSLHSPSRLIKQKAKSSAERGRRRAGRFISIFAVTILGSTPLASLHAQSVDAPYTVTTPAPDGFDRAQAQSASLAHIEALIGRDTQNPPGNELLTAQYFDSVFAKIPGVERHILPAGQGRANFVARLRASNPTKRPVMIMGHMDVVGVDVSKWKTAPFTGTVVNEPGSVDFERLARIEKDPTMKAAMQRVSAPGASVAQIDEAADILSREPLHNAVLRTGQSLTIIKGGIRSNVIPSDGIATFNVRVLPNDDVRGIVQAFNRVGDEKQVKFTLDGEPRTSPPVSPETTALYQAMEASALAMVPTATVIPFMSTGGTDGAKLRAKGIPTYGILPLPLPMEDELRMHGDNERVPVPALGWAAEFLYRTLQRVTTR